MSPIQNEFGFGPDDRSAAATTCRNSASRFELRGSASAPPSSSHFSLAFCQFACTGRPSSSSVPTAKCIAGVQYAHPSYDEEDHSSSSQPGFSMWHHGEPPAHAGSEHIHVAANASQAAQEFCAQSRTGC